VVRISTMCVARPVFTIFAAGTSVPEDHRYMYNEFMASCISGSRSRREHRVLSDAFLGLQGMPRRLADYPNAFAAELRVLIAPSLRLCCWCSWRPWPKRSLPSAGATIRGAWARHARMDPVLTAPFTPITPAQVV